MTMSGRFPDKVMELLLEAGWSEGRDVIEKVHLPPLFELFPAARSILGEFGLLKIGTSGRGVQLARSDVDMDPSGAVDRFEALSEEGEIWSMRFYPLGLFHRGNWWLVVSENGNVFLDGEEFRWFAFSFDEALVCLLLGLKRPAIPDYLKDKQQASLENIYGK